MSTFETGYEIAGESPFQEWEIAGEFEQGEFEQGGYGQGEFEQGGYGQGEVFETELAQELLGIATEAELEQFLGNLVRGAVGGVGRLIRSDVGRALGGVLKGVAKRALPAVGSALGTFVAPGIGTAIGGQLGSYASNLLEIGEAETLGEEEAELEAARRYVRFARAAARNATLAPPNVPSRAVARTAAVAAARRYAPALLRPTSRRQPRRWRDRRAARYSYGPEFVVSPTAQAPWGWPVEATSGQPTSWDSMPAAGPPGGGAQDVGSDSGDGGGEPGDPFAGAGYDDSGEFQLP
jgi:hypothetical protein